MVCAAGPGITKAQKSKHNDNREREIRQQGEPAPRTPRTKDEDLVYIPTWPVRRTGIKISLSESEESSAEAAAARSSIFSMSSSPKAGRGLDVPLSPDGTDSGILSRDAGASAAGWPLVVSRRRGVPGVPNGSSMSISLGLRKWPRRLGCESDCECRCDGGRAVGRFLRGPDGRACRCGLPLMGGS